MCVTVSPAVINGTRTFVYATEIGNAPMHVCGYQNEAKALAGPNCMFLNFAGKDLSLVRGPEHTTTFMRDMTSQLPELEPMLSTRSNTYGTYGAKGITVEDYGDYTMILAQGPSDILSVLDEVPVPRRPRLTRELQAMVDFYMSFCPGDSFALGCFSGQVKPRHPITVKYTPRDPSVLTIPGLDGHDGRVPVIGAPVYRDFRVAFGIQGVQLPHNVRYTDNVQGQPWAPESVAGFSDNRVSGPNGDYIVPVSAVQTGLTGRELADQLIEQR